MALTQFAFGLLGDQSTGEMIAAFLRETVTSEQIAPNGSSQSTTAAAPYLGRRPVCRVATDTAIFVAFGAAPDATNVANRFYLPAGGVDVFVLEKGDKAAVIAA